MMVKDGIIYFFTGKDELKKSTAIDKIKAKLSLTLESLDYNKYYAQDVIASDVIQTLQTPPFSTSRRLVILKEIEDLSPDDKEKIALYLKQPSKHSVFIITTQKNLGLNNKFHIMAKKYAYCIDFPAQEHNIFAQKPMFYLIDEISSKKQKSALGALLVLTEAGKSAYEILGMLAWHVRRLGKVKVLLRKGADGKKITSDLKLSYNIAQKIINQAKNFSFEELSKAQHLLLETDSNLKKSTATPETMLAMLVTRLSSSL